jgi:hypothetical protein
MKTKLLKASIIGFLVGMGAMFLIGWFSPFNHGTAWRDEVIEIQKDNIQMQRELEIYHINQAQVEAYDRQTWGGVHEEGVYEIGTAITLPPNTYLKGESLWTYEGQKITSIPDTLDTMEVR